MSLLALAAAATLTCSQATVHDGDTVRCGPLAVRLANIDAPEVKGSPRCRALQVAKLAGSRNPAWCDFAAGERAKAALQAFLATGPVRLRIVGNGSYGRVLGKLSVRGRDAGAYLVRHGYAHRWR